MNETPPCKTDPRAPHGFDRNASHNLDRYVCECEHWTPVDGVTMSEERVHISDKSEHEPDLEAPLTVNGVPLYPKKKWVGLTPEEFNEINQTATKVGYAIIWTEAKLREKNT